MLHGQEKAGYADAGYLGVEKREEILRQCPGVEWHVAAKRGKIKAMAEGAIKELAVQLEKRKAQVRARGEHPVASALRRRPAGKGSALWLSRSARFTSSRTSSERRKTRYRGLARNTAQLHSLFALANLIIARRSLLTTVGA